MIRSPTSAHKWVERMKKEGNFERVRSQLRDAINTGEKLPKLDCYLYNLLNDSATMRRVNQSYEELLIDAKTMESVRDFHDVVDALLSLQAKVYGIPEVELIA